MKRKWIMMLVVMVLLLSGCAESNNIVEENDKEINIGYATATEYDGKESYIFAVELDEFDGDVLESGVYTFSTTSTTASAIMYDIYISKELKDPSSGFAEEEFFNTSGGLSPIDFEVTLTKGDYVYIIYYEQLMDADGTLTITKIN